MADFRKPARLSDAERAARAEVGGRIREARRARRLTLAELCAKADISRVMDLSQFERGLRPISPVLLRAVSDALGISTDDLIRGGGPLTLTEGPGATVEAQKRRAAPKVRTAAQADPQ